MVLIAEPFCMYYNFVHFFQRNPDIQLYCLPWAFPAWVGEGSRNPYHNINKTADYVVKFILGAMKYYKLKMDYVGVCVKMLKNTK